MKLLESYLASYEAKDQEYTLVQSLKRRAVKNIQEELKNLAEQISMGPFHFKAYSHSLGVQLDGADTVTEVGLKDKQTNEYMTYESYCDKLLTTLSNCLCRSIKEDTEKNKSYITLILFTFTSDDMYNKLKDAYERKANLEKELDEVNAEFHRWRVEMWDELYRVAKEWVTIDNIKPGMYIEVLNLKNYKSQIKQVWKVLGTSTGVKIVCKDNSRVEFRRIGRTHTWVMAHPEYAPLLDYLNRTESDEA